MKTHSRSRCLLVLTCGLLCLTALAGRSHAGAIMLTGSAVLPLPAFTVAALGWLPNVKPDCLYRLDLCVQPDPDEHLRDEEFSLWRRSTRDAVPSIFQDQSLTVLRAGTGSYHGYQAPTTLHTGYGCFFEEESWKLSHASSQSIEEPSHFYLKLTFRF